MTNIRANGINHLALSTANMKEQIAFFTDVLGAELVALYWMHGAEGCWHGFLRLNDHCAVAFVFHPENAAAEAEPGRTHSGHAGGPSAPGTMQHLALNVDGHEALLAMRDRIRSRGVNVMGPLDHGMCHSIYFSGPEGLTLEMATFGDAAHPIGPKDWIDPEVVELAGIDADELARFTNPEPFEGRGGTVPQPEYDPAGYHPALPEERLRAGIAMSDEFVTKTFSEPTPPSKMGKG